MIYNTIRSVCDSSINHINTEAKKLFVISGAGSSTGRSLIQKALSEGDVVGLSTRNMKTFEQTGLHFVQMKSGDLMNPTAIAESVSRVIAKQGNTPYKKIYALNLIGGPSAQKNLSLEQLNISLPTSFFKGVSMFSRQENASFSMGSISSIAATISSDECPYAEVKRAADQRFCELGKEMNANTIVLRPGIILKRMTPDGIIDSGHDYSPEQFANQFFHIHVGSGNQLQQPVTEDCLFEALLSGLHQPGQNIINAVGDKPISMKEFFQFFSNRNKIFNISAPYTLTEFFARRVPRGRFQEYAIQMLKEQESPEKNIPICSEEFRRLLPRKTIRTLHDFYPDNQARVTLPPPYLKHMSQIFKYLFRTRHQ